MEPLKGFDVSHHNGQFAVSKYAKGRDFVICKATEGVGFVDKEFDSNIKLAKMNGLLIGAYHYARPDLNANPEVEAASFVTVVKEHVGNILLALDWEGLSINHKYDGWALNWCEYVYQETGVRPVIYVSESCIPYVNDCGQNGFGLWVAKWSDKKVNLNGTAWEFMALRQTTNKPIDLDEFYGTETQWKKYCTPEFEDADVGLTPGTCHCGCTCCGKEE